jgi:hypothetical protein
MIRALLPPGGANGEALGEGSAEINDECSPGRPTSSPGMNARGPPECIADY